MAEAAAVSILLLMSLFCLARTQAQNPLAVEQTAQKTCNLISSDYEVFGALLERFHRHRPARVSFLTSLPGPPKGSHFPWYGSNGPVQLLPGVIYRTTETLGKGR